MEAFEKARSLAPDSPHVRAYIARCPRADGTCRGIAAVYWVSSSSCESTGFLHATGPALVYLALGEFDNAFEMLESSFAERSVWLIWMKVSPVFDPIRDDPRYTSLLKRLHLAKLAIAHIFSLYKRTRNTVELARSRRDRNNFNYGRIGSTNARSPLRA